MKENELTSPRIIRELLDRYGLKAQKKWGQNFLMDYNVLKKIIGAAEITSEDTVLEIGPGLGALTAALSEQAGRVIAVEADRSLRHVLEETLSGRKNIEILWQNILEVDLCDLFSGRPLRKNLKAVANLPYYLTTPILFFLLESGVHWERMVFMVQKEVADRIVSPPGTKGYGLLTVNIQVYGKAELIATVPPTVFYPEPGVKSAIIRICLWEKPKVEREDKKIFDAIVRPAFIQRRKTLCRAMVNAGLGDSKTITEIIRSAGIDPERRGETLHIHEFVALMNAYRCKE